MQQIGKFLTDFAESFKGTVYKPRKPFILCEGNPGSLYIYIWRMTWIDKLENFYPLKIEKKQEVLGHKHKMLKTLAIIVYEKVKGMNL
ncbi:hypothetical protein DBT40_01290 [Aerococcus tenax]|nr:hypothetical protein [Aerococcus urinae]RAV72813.1 hypothetical protein DBT40_01290 [Aerococcus urinae]RAW05547.1 hypothetical protein DBT41_01290 [Aerococcus urinae]